MQKLAFIVRNEKTVPNLKLTKKNSKKKKKKGFWTFNKNVKYWNVCNPDWNYRGDFFSLKPLGRFTWK